MEKQNSFRQNEAISTLFNHEYLNGKSLFLYLTGRIPSVLFVNEVDPFDAISSFRKKYESQIKDWYNEGVWNHETQGPGMENTFFVMENDVIFQFGHSFIHVMHDMEQWEFVEEVIKLISVHRKAPEPTEDFEDDF